jgi:hypothetical protein
MNVEKIPGNLRKPVKHFKQTPWVDFIKIAPHLPTLFKCFSGEMGES